MAMIFKAFKSHQRNKSADLPTRGVARVLNEQQSKPGFSLPVIWKGLEHRLVLMMAAAFLSATADDELLAGQQLEVVH
jgi:hypothetical protein